MPRFFGSADEDELARRRAVGDMRGTPSSNMFNLGYGQSVAYGTNKAGNITGDVVTNAKSGVDFANAWNAKARQVSPDAPAQPRYFGSNIAPIRDSAPGRTPTMFSAVPGDRSLLERDMMQSARGSGASRRALMAERQQYDAGQEQTRRMDMAEQKRKAEQEEARLDRQGKLDVARETGTGAAKLTADSRLEVARLNAKEARNRLTTTQRHEIDVLDREHKDELALIEKQGLDKESKDAAVETLHMNRLDELKKKGFGDIALEEAKAMILAGTVSTEKQTQTTDKKTGKITVTKDKGTTFTRPEGLPGQGEQGMDEQGVDADQNGIDDNATFTPPNSDVEYNVNNMAKFIALFESKQKSNLKADKDWVDLRRAEYAKQSIFFKTWKTSLVKSPTGR